MPQLFIFKMPRYLAGHLRSESLRAHLEYEVPHWIIEPGIFEIWNLISATIQLPSYHVICILPYYYACLNYVSLKCQDFLQVISDQNCIA